MATDFEMRHEFNCAPDTLWAMLEDEAIDREMAAASGANTEWLGIERDDTISTRKQVTLDLDLPGAMRKAIGSDTISYVLETHREASGNVQEWTIRPNVLGDRFRCHGTTTVEPTATGCRRVIRGHVAIRVPLLGGKMESRLVETTKESYDAGAEVLRRRIAEQ